MKIIYFFSLIIIGNAKKPNIVLIVGDDMGWNDFGFHGSNQIPTPNIDALGYNGVILDKYYTQQTCTPSRAALLTGNYPIRSGLQGTPLTGGERRHIPFDMLTLPERLKELNYSTHLIGKWHLGASSKNVTPIGRGFDSHFGYWNGFCGYFNYRIPSEYLHIPNTLGFDLHRNFVPAYEYEGQYATELFTKKSLDVIENHDHSHPLFLMVTHLAAHTGYDGIELGVPNITKTKETYNYIPNPERQKFADVVNLLDDSVGRIVKKLSEKKMLENSIIIFFSDNGAQTVGLYQNHGSGWPFRGLKFTLYEGGVRGSCVIFSPLLKKKGYINTQLMHITDFLPTLYHAAGGNVEHLGKIDGINQWDVISDNLPTKRKNVLLNVDEVHQASGILGNDGQYKLLNGTFQNGIYDYYYGDSGRAAENPPYNIESILNSPANVAIQKLHKQSTLLPENILKLRSQLDRSWCRQNNLPPVLICKGLCLFDLYKDPCETKNIINDPEKENIVLSLANKLTVYFNELVPQQNQDIDPKANPIYCNNTWFLFLDKDGCHADQSSLLGLILSYIESIFTHLLLSVKIYV